MGIYFAADTLDSGRPETAKTEEDPTICRTRTERADALMNA